MAIKRVVVVVIHLSDYCYFSDIVLQNNLVIHLKCDEICSDLFRFTGPAFARKNYGNQSTFGRVTAKEKGPDFSDAECTMYANVMFRRVHCIVASEAK